ncbi:MAG: tripartite tricarboxylate transporter substrate binding protein [Rhizobiales bacterium]|nr:tripartite tricarboxylate transporter substrate binding protein [Hyphomicrobiales bacterium]
MTGKGFQALWVAITAAMWCASMSAVYAQGDYPSRSIKIVVPVSAGGAPDVVARLIADKLSERFRQPVIVENRPGAGERIGAEYVAKAAPDGYTVLATPPGVLVIAPHLYRKLPFDAAAFVPVSVLTRGHLLLVARPTIAAASVLELVALAKANPGKLTYASPGAGTPPHLTGEMFKAAAGIQTTHVPYKGLAPAVADLLAGHVDFMFDNIGNSLPHIRAGRLKVLGIASEARISELPNVPTIAETFPAVTSSSWFGMVAPPKTSAAIAIKLSQAIADVLKLPDVTAKLRAMSFTPVGSSPAEMVAVLRQDSQRWQSVIAAAEIKRE